MNTKPVPMTGKLLQAIVKRVCAPDDDKHSPILASVALGDHSVVATDQRQAIVVGQLDAAYVPTDRRSVLLEAARAEIYTDTCEFQNVQRVADANGEPFKYPDLPKVVEEMRFMTHVADLNPRLLKAAAEIAVAAGAERMSLYRKASGEDGSMLGMAFEYTLDLEQLTLDFDGANNTDELLAPVPVIGVLVGMRETRESKRAPDVEAIPSGPLATAAIVEAMDIQELADSADCELSIVTAKGTRTAKPRKPKPPIPTPVGMTPEQEAWLAAVAPELWASILAFTKARPNVSTSVLQREFRIGFMTADACCARMEQLGIVGPRVGPSPRPVLEEA